MRDPLAVERYVRRVLTTMLIIIIILIAMLFSACMTVEKATDYLKKEGALEKVCDENIPDVEPQVIYKTSIDSAMVKRQRAVIDSLLKETGKVAETIRYKDTCSKDNIGMPVISAEELEAWQRKIYRLEHALRKATDSLKNFRPDTVLQIQPDKYAVAVLTDELRATQDELNDMTASRKWWRSTLIWHWIILAIAIALWIFRNSIRMTLGALQNRFRS